MPVPVEAAAGLFGQPAEQVAFEAVQLQRPNWVAAVFALFAQLAGFVVDVRQQDFPPLLVEQDFDARNRTEAV